MERYVIDLEYANKLKELGVKRSFDFKYVKTIEKYTEDTFEYAKNYTLKYTSSNLEFLNYDPEDVINAYTSDDLMTILPSHLDKKIGLKVSKETSGIYTVCYCGHQESMEDLKLSNALAKLLIWCIENEYYKLD